MTEGIFLNGDAFLLGPREHSRNGHVPGAGYGEAPLCPVPPQFTCGGGVPASGEICGPETESGRHSQGQDVPELRRDRPRPDSDMPAPSVAPLCSDMFGALPGVSSSSCFSGDRCPGAGAYVSVLPRSMRISSCVNTADVFHSLFIRLSLTGGTMRRGGVEFRPVP